MAEGGGCFLKGSGGGGKPFQASLTFNKQYANCMQIITRFLSLDSSGVF